MVYWFKKQNKRILICLMISIMLLCGCTVEQDREKAAEYYAEGVAAYERGDIDQAISAMRKASKYDQYHVEYAVQLIDFLRNKGDFEEAENISVKAIKLNPENIDVRMAAGANYIAWVQSIANYLDMGALADKGLKQFNYVLAKDPDHFDALLYRANTYSNYPDIGGIHEQAEIDYIHLLELEVQGENPNYALVYYYYGIFLEQNKKEMEKARMIWRKGFELYPDNDLLKEKVY